METKDILKDLRTRANYSQQKLADITGISKTVLAELETGKRNIGLAILTKLADFYGVTLDYIMGREQIQEIDNRSDIEVAVADNNLTAADEEFLKQNQDQLIQVLKQKQNEIDRLKKRIAELESEKLIQISTN